MKPFDTLGETHGPDGARFSLHRHEDEYSLKFDGAQLMSSGWTVSEQLLADAACAWKNRPAAPRLLIGGLGLGFSLKRVLELVGKAACVDVAEILPEVVAWNREFLTDLNGALLEDPRVVVHIADVYDWIEKAGPARFDAILLDVDNGSTCLVQPENWRLYDRDGLAVIRASLRPGGRVAFWAADPEPQFLKQLRKAGFVTKEIHAKANESAKRAEHRIYVGERVN